MPDATQPIPGQAYRSGGARCRVVAVEGDEAIIEESSHHGVSRRRIPVRYFREGSLGRWAWWQPVTPKVPQRSRYQVLMGDDIIPQEDDDDEH